jgi:ferredoxin, 2Fe-2S
MARIRFLEHDGTEYLVTAPSGQSVMRAATDHGVPGLQAECGGNLACATCHGYIDPQYYARLPPPTDIETLLLEGAIDPKSNSRLTCQITITDDLDGMTVQWPASQY